MQRFAVLIIWLTLSPWLWGQQLIDARATGMAFSNGAVTTGLGQLGLNPATLAMETPYRFELNLFSGAVGLHNNSFTKSQYDDYLTTGRFLTEQDIEDILNSIPDSGVRVDFFGGASALSVYVPNFSLAVSGAGSGFSRVPKTLFELALRGNREPGKVYDFGDTEGSGWAGIAIRMSGAYPFPTSEDGMLTFASAGITLKYLKGLAYGEITESSGQIQDSNVSNNNPYVHISGSLETVSATGGTGLGVDLGALFTLRKDVTVGITLINALGSITWNEEVEKNVFRIRGDSLEIAHILEDLVEGTYDELPFFGSDPNSRIRETDTTFSIDEFKTGLPRVLDVALAYRGVRDLVITAEYEQGFSTNLGGTRKARLALGLEYRGVPVLPLRAGISFGGKPGTSLGLGAGLDVKVWTLDVAFLNHGGIFPGSSSRGLTLALTTRLRL